MRKCSAACRQGNYRDRRQELWPTCNTDGILPCHWRRQMTGTKYRQAKTHAVSSQTWTLLVTRHIIVPGIYENMDMYHWVTQTHQLTCYQFHIKGLSTNLPLRLIIEISFKHRGADKSLARPDWKNNWKVAIFRPTWRSLLPRRPGWTDNLLNCFWVASKS